MMKASRGLLSVVTGLNAKRAFATFVLGIASAVAAAVQDAAMDHATMNHALVDSAPVNAAVGVAFGVPYVYALPLAALRPDESAGMLNVNAETAIVAVWTPPRAG